MKEIIKQLKRWYFKLFKTLIVLVMFSSCCTHKHSTSVEYIQVEKTIQLPPDTIEVIRSVPVLSIDTIYIENELVSGHVIVKPDTIKTIVEVFVANKDSIITTIEEKIITNTVIKHKTPNYVWYLIIFLIAMVICIIKLK